MADGAEAELRVLGPDDRDAFEAFLMPHLASSMFLLGNVRLAGLVDTGERFSGTYVAAFVGGEIVGVAAHFWNGGLMAQVPEPWTGKVLEPLWRAAVRASGRRVWGVVGADDQACAIMSALRYAPEAVQMNYREKLYDLDLARLIVPDLLSTGKVAARLAEARDLDTLVRWRIDDEIEKMNAEDTQAFRLGVRESQTASVADGTVWVLEAGGTLVSTTGFNAVLREVVQVGGVYTPPEYRSRGYARSGVAASLLASRDAGVTRGILFTGEDNLPAQKAYAALGFRQVGYFRLFFLRDGITV